MLKVCSNISRMCTVTHCTFVRLRSSPDFNTNL